MTLKCGLVGLPNVGKSALFNALTQSNVASENFAFCTIDPHLGTVNVPDPRLTALEEVVNPQKTIQTTIEFTDIAGLVEGASKGEGLGNQFLAHIRETDAVIHVLRCFINENITHVHQKIDPIQDREIIHTELCIADLTIVENSITKHKRKAQGGEKEAQLLTNLLEKKLLPCLAEGKFLRTLPLTDGEKQLIKSFGFLTMKSTLYVLNQSDDASQNIETEELEKLIAEEGSVCMKINIKLEAEIAELAPEDKDVFLEELGVSEPALGRFIRCCYSLLDLQTFFTAGPKELRAWTLTKGATALAAAGQIHNDFIKHFIRAETVSYNDYIDCGGEQNAKAKGLLRLEGKDYQVADGDILYFRTSA